MYICNAVCVHISELLFVWPCGSFAVEWFGEFFCFVFAGSGCTSSDETVHDVQAEVGERAPEGKQVKQKEEEKEMIFKKKMNDY